MALQAQDGHGAQCANVRPVSVGRCGLSHPPSSEAVALSVCRHCPALAYRSSACARDLISLHNNPT